MAISFFSMLKSLMILKRSGNGNSSSYKEKMYLMQRRMLLPATNTSLVKTASQWHFKERDRKQVFSVVQLPFHFRGWQDIDSCSLFSFFLALLFPFTECVSAYTWAFIWPLMTSSLCSSATYDPHASFSLKKTRHISLFQIQELCVHWRNSGKYRICVKKEKVSIFIPFSTHTINSSVFFPVILSICLKIMSLDF